VPINVYSFQAKFPTPKGSLDITTSKVHRDILTSLARNQTLFAEHGIAGYNFIHKDKVVLLQIMPSADTEAIKTITSQWHDFLTNYPGLTIGENKYYSFDKFSEWHKFSETPEISRNGPVGLGMMIAGRFIPRELFGSNENIDQLVNAVLTAMQLSYTNKAGGSAQLYSTGPWNHPDNSKTGVNPEWRNRNGCWLGLERSVCRSRANPEHGLSVCTTIQGTDAWRWGLCKRGRLDGRKLATNVLRRQLRPIA
jgi:hypothetical protein